MKIKNPYFEYSHYLNSHIQNVKKAFKYLVNNNLIFNSLSLQEQIEEHDESKYNPDEWHPYENYFYGEVRTKEIEDKFDKAWNRHQKRNPHHWQYWVLIGDSGNLKTLEMPYNFIVEMVCDWWSFSWEPYNLYKIFDWYEENKDKQIMHKNTRKTVEEILEAIRRSLDNLNLLSV